MYSLLPAEYEEVPFVPAYQVDNRFGRIEEKNIYKQGIRERTENYLKSRSSNCSTVTASGHLNKKDTFCFQCLKPKIDKKTQEWFFNFLMIKDLHANYTFLTTCLVPSWADSSRAKCEWKFLQDRESGWPAEFRHFDLF